MDSVEYAGFKVILIEEDDLLACQVPYGCGRFARFEVIQDTSSEDTHSLLCGFHARKSADELTEMLWAVWEPLTRANPYNANMVSKMETAIQKWRDDYDGFFWRNRGGNEEDEDEEYDEDVADDPEETAAPTYFLTTETVPPVFGGLPQVAPATYTNPQEFINQLHQVMDYMDNQQPVQPAPPTYWPILQGYEEGGVITTHIPPTDLQPQWTTLDIPMEFVIDGD